MAETSMIRRSVAAPIAALLAAACGAEAPDTPIAVVRDSAGIEIVENRWAPEEVASGWRVDAVPVVDIGVLEGDEALQLFNVAGGALLGDGRIAVVNGGTQEVRIYDAGGAPDTVFGGDGEGPGEFRQPRLAGVRSDTLMLYDMTLRRMTAWHPTAGVVREFAVGGEGGGFPVPQGMFDDGAVVFGGGVMFSSDTGFPSGLIRQSSTYGSVTATGAPGADFGEFPSMEMFARVAGGSFSARSIPFARVTNAAAADSSFYVGTQDAWEIRVFSPDGRLRRLIRTDRPAAPVTEALRSRYIDAALEDAEDETARRTVRQDLAAMPFGETVPPYEALVVDDLGHLWVSDASLPGDDVTAWSVFDPSGRLVGRIDLAARTRLLDVQRARLLVVVTDDLGVERVRVLRLERPED